MVMKALETEGREVGFRGCPKLLTSIYYLCRLPLIDFLWGNEHFSKCSGMPKRLAYL
jgi:hypothetical protein